MHLARKMLGTNGWKPQGIGNVPVCAGATRYVCDVTYGWVRQSGAGNWYPAHFQQALVAASAEQVPDVISAEDIYTDVILAEQAAELPWNWERLQLLRERGQRRRVCRQAHDAAYAADPERFHPTGANIVELNPGAGGLVPSRGSWSR